jgi:metallo-beta-lactamase family protein
MLQDSAFIQERDAEFLNKKLVRKKQPRIEPLYTVADAQACMPLFVGRHYNRPFDVMENVRATFLNAGHMLGSAMLLLEIKEGNRAVRLGFTGDLGRKNLPIIEDPDQLDRLDYLICESTYGNRRHDPVKEIENDLVRVIHDAADKRGKIIVPAFSVERTQEIVYHLNKLYESRKVPALPVFVDSPLAVNVTEVFKMHPTYWDEEASCLLETGDNPFVFHGLHYVSRVEESKRLNDLDEPCIIIAASGMCEAGRILHHLANNVENPRTTVLIVGFMAEHTLGRRLVDKAEKVKILGDEFTVRASVVKINSFSGHADQDDLMGFVKRAGHVKGVFLVHGELQQSSPFAERIREHGVKNVLIPELNQTVVL